MGAPWNRGGSMSSFRKNLKYWIPFLGTRQLLKRIERVERELNDLKYGDASALTLYYEARTEALYDAICKRISLDIPVIDKGRIRLKIESGTGES
jgi:hypothetical protein